MSLTTLLVDARPVDHPTARQRGIGRYVTGLLTGLRDIGAPVIALYGTDTEADVLAHTVPGLACRRWSPQTVREHANTGTWYLATQLMLHPIPLDPIPRCITDARLPVAAVMYDVIPYRYPEVHFADPTARNQAALRASLARTVDALLAISDFAGSTAAEELAYPLERIVTIGAGLPTEFRREPLAARHGGSEIGDGVGRVLPPTVGRYVVTVAGADEHKNIERLLQAWAGVERVLAGTRHLVLAGSHTAEARRRWEAWVNDAGVADRVIITGRLDDDELVAVLRGAELAVSPSIEEGFGLPVLEAAACGVAVITSNVSSLPEVLNEPEACFDPFDPAAIAAAIVRALTDETHRAVLHAAGARAVERWTWTHVANATIEALDHLGPRWPQRVRPPAERVAIAGLLDGTAGGALGARNAGLVEALRRSGAEVIALVDNGGSPEPTHAAADRFPVRALGRFVKPWDVDHVVAALGAAPQHVATSAAARSAPCHLWIDDDAMVGVRFGANLQALEIARSAIVGSRGAAELVRAAADRPCPILVVPSDLGADELAGTLRAWLAEVDELDPSTIRDLTSAISSPDP